MRIAMFTNNYKPYIGGVPISIEHLAAAMREEGHEVYIFAPSYANQQEEEYVIRYPSVPVSIAGAPIPNVLTVLFEEKVLELDIEVIHVHHPALVGNVALYLQKKHQIPVVYTYHTRYEAYLHYVKPLCWLEKQTEFVEKYLIWFCNRCDYLIAPTKGMQNYLKGGRIETQTEILPTGLPIGNFTANTDRVKKLRRQYMQATDYQTGIQTDNQADNPMDYLLCSIARLAEEKNLLFQLRGLKLLKQRLAKQQKKVRLMILGEGPQKQQLIAEVHRLGLEENVVFVGYVENQEIPDYLKACDMFVFSSKSETQGIVILEAMAVGLPIVAIRASGVEDIVREGQTGFLTAEEEGEWAERIEELLESPAQRKEMGNQGQILAWQYEESRVARNAVHIYDLAKQERLQRAEKQMKGKTGWLHRYNMLN